MTTGLGTARRPLVTLRLATVLGLGALALGTVGACGATPRGDQPAPAGTRPAGAATGPAEATDPAAWETYAAAPRVVFRSTTIGPSFGLVASVPLADPAAPRAVSHLACDRVYAAADALSCLRTEQGATTRYAWLETTPDLVVRQVLPLAGPPSRTRLSPDGTLVASTSFVRGHEYRQVGFSTATVVRRVGGATLGNLESFALVRDGRVLRPADRNVWGVTFAPDDRTFYASVSTGDVAHLVRGDLVRRTLTVVRPGAECPSLSPDGRRVAYKVDVAPGDAVLWKLAVLDLDSGRQTLLDSGPTSVDDQVEWLDRSTLLYGLARAAAPGQTDVWALDAVAGAVPRVFLRDAWSPAVVRTPSGGTS